MNHNFHIDPQFNNMDIPIPHSMEEMQVALDLLALRGTSPPAPGRRGAMTCPPDFLKMHKEFANSYRITFTSVNPLDTRVSLAKPLEGGIKQQDELVFAKWNRDEMEPFIKIVIMWRGYDINWQFPIDTREFAPSVPWTRARLAKHISATVQKLFGLFVQQRYMIQNGHRGDVPVQHENPIWAIAGDVCKFESMLLRNIYPCHLSRGKWILEMGVTAHDNRGYNVLPKLPGNAWVI